ncbi:hypothetical protein FACS1894182_10340 [Bacteroidia bacterium]|nr:hypothetical protein FACS1894182_10340 [Bacteroidia bacterium]
MKKLSRLKLNVLSEQSLEQRQMNELRGGEPYDSTCSCSCYWESSGGSSTADNAETNAKSGYTSSQGCNQYQFTPGDGWDYCDTCTA